MSRFFLTVVVFVFFGCAEVVPTLNEDILNDENRSTRKPVSVEAIPADGKGMQTNFRKEGPNGDMDGDGILNQYDSDPLLKTEGPDGDMDGDGIPNKDDKDPLGQVND